MKGGREAEKEGGKRMKKKEETEGKSEERKGGENRCQEMRRVQGTKRQGER